MAWLDRFRDDLLRGRGYWLASDNTVFGWLVRRASKTVVESAELGLCAGVVCAFSEHGDCGLAGVAQAGMARSCDSAHAFCCATGVKRRLVGTVFCASFAWASFRGIGGALGGNPGDDDFLLARNACRRLADGSIPGLGDFCGRA